MKLSLSMLLLLAALACSKSNTTEVPAPSADESTMEVPTTESEDVSGTNPEGASNTETNAAQCSQYTAGSAEYSDCVKDQSASGIDHGADSDTGAGTVE